MTINSDDHGFPQESPPGIVAYFVAQIVERYVRFYDTIALGSYRFEHHELPTINDLMNQAFSSALKRLEILLGRQFDSRVPYESFELETIINSWFASEKSRCLRLKFDVESSSPIGGGNMPPSKTQFMWALDKRLDEISFQRAKYDADQFRVMYQEQDRIQQLQTSNQDTVFPQNSFDFVADIPVRLTINSFYQELRFTYFTESVKSSIILTGAIIEALLADALSKCDSLSKEAYSKCFPDAKEKEIKYWKLNELIEAALEINVVPRDLKGQLDSIRSFRNFVHIQRLAESGIQLDKSYKEICKNVLDIVVKHVAGWMVVS